MHRKTTFFKVAVSTIALAAALLAASPARAYQYGSTVNEVNYGTGRVISSAIFTGGATANILDYAQAAWSSYGISTTTSSTPQWDYAWVGLYCPSACATPPPTDPGALDIIQVGVYYGTSFGSRSATIEAQFCSDFLQQMSVSYTPGITDIYTATVGYSGGATATLRLSDYTQGKADSWTVSIPTWCRSTVTKAAGFIDETQGSGAVYSNLWIDNHAPLQSLVGWYNTTTGQHLATPWYLPMTYIDDTLSNGTVDGTTGDSGCSGSPQVCTAWINSGVGGLYSDG